VTIYIGNLSYQVTEQDLKEVFAEYGTVKKVSLPIERETGRVRGFGFVDLETDAQENTAIEELDGAEWLGRKLRVNKAKPKENNSGGGGRRGGGGGGYRSYNGEF
jgi:RNA recognition motif-containing protein